VPGRREGGEVGLHKPPRQIVTAGGDSCRYIVTVGGEKGRRTPPAGAPHLHARPDLVVVTEVV